MHSLTAHSHILICIHICIVPLTHTHTTHAHTVTWARLPAHKHKLPLSPVSLHGRLCLVNSAPTHPPPGIARPHPHPQAPAYPSFPVQPSGVPGKEASPRSRCPERQLSSPSSLLRSGERGDTGRAGADVEGTAPRPVVAKPPGCRPALPVAHYRRAPWRTLVPDGLRTPGGVRRARVGGRPKGRGRRPVQARRREPPGRGRG